MRASSCTPTSDTSCWSIPHLAVLEVVLLRLRQSPTFAVPDSKLILYSPLILRASFINSSGVAFMLSAMNSAIFIAALAPGLRSLIVLHRRRGRLVIGFHNALQIVQASVPHLLQERRLRLGVGGQPIEVRPHLGDEVLQLADEFFRPPHSPPRQRDTKNSRRAFVLREFFMSQ